MAIYVGLNTGNYLSDVDNQAESLRNLGLNRLDLDHIRGIQEEGVTTNQLHNLSGLDVDQEKSNFSNYTSALYVSRRLSEVPTINLPTDFNLRINNQLRAGAIKYNYLDYSQSPPATKSADISTSRVSSWSQVGDGPIFYGADTKIKAQGGTSTAQFENIVFTGELSPKRFDAEVPTHRVTVNVNGNNRDFFTMRNIPFRFEGTFRRARIKLETDAGPKPTILFTNTAFPEGAIGKEVPVHGSTGGTKHTFVYSTNSADILIDIYQDPSTVKVVDFFDDQYWRTNTTLMINKFPNVVLPKLKLVDLQFQDFAEMPDFYNISGANTPGGGLETPLSIVMHNNGLNRSSKTAQQQLREFIPHYTNHLYISACFSDGEPIDVRQLRDSGGTQSLVDSQLQTFHMDARYWITDKYRKMLNTSTSSNNIAPRVNGDTIRNYLVQRQGYRYLPHDVTHNTSDGQPNNLQYLRIHNNSMLSQLNSAGAVTGATITVPDTIYYIEAAHNQLEVIDVRNKPSLAYYWHYYNYGSANPAGGIDGYFDGCGSLKYLNFIRSYVEADVANLFSNLPNLETAYFRETRLNGRMTPGTFVGTTKLNRWEASECRWNSSPGQFNFFGNDWVPSIAQAPPGGFGTSYEGGYYAGTMTDGTDQYHLVVSDKTHERFLPRFNGSATDDGGQGDTNTHAGYDNTAIEYKGAPTGGTADEDYEAASYVSGLNIGGYNDWYIPAKDELELMYRSLKPTSNPNFIQAINNTNAVDPSPMQGQYSAGAPSQTASNSFKASGSEYFNSSTNAESSIGEINYMYNGQFSGSLMNPFTPNVGTNTFMSNGQLITRLDNDGVCQLFFLIGTPGPISDLPKGTYELKVNFAEVTQTSIDSGNFAVGTEYKVLSLGDGNTADWNVVGDFGGSTPIVGSTFTASTNGATISGGRAQPQGSTYTGDTVEVRGNKYMGAGAGNVGDEVFVVSQGLTATPSEVSTTFYMEEDHEMYVFIHSRNADFKINSISLTNQVGYYWSSSEGFNTVDVNGNAKVTGFAQSFKTGEIVEAPKGSLYNVRPVRRVPIASVASQEQQGTSDTFQPVGNSLTIFKLFGAGKGVTTNNPRGKMPDMSGLIALKEFELLKCDITGVIPDVQNCQSLRVFKMHDNNMSGTFTMINQSVRNIQVQNNEFTACSVIRCPNASELNLSDNNIAGAFPDLDQSRKLAKIYFQNNQLQNYATGSLVNCTKLNNLNLNNNDLNVDSVKRLLSDMVKNHKQANRGGVSILLKSNPKISKANLIEDEITESHIDYLLGKGWKIDMNA